MIESTHNSLTIFNVNNNRHSPKRRGGEAVETPTHNLQQFLDNYWKLADLKIPRKPVSRSDFEKPIRVNKIQQKNLEKK